MRINFPGRGTPPMQSVFSNYVAELRALPARPGVVAYFDVDRTLIPGYTITSLAWECFWSGELSPRRVITHAGIFLGYGLGRASYHDLLQATARALAGLPEKEMIDLGERAFMNRLAALIYAEARIVIDLHKEKGHDVVLMTSATRYQAEPMAQALGVDNVCCTELEIVGGRITGNATPCHGESKKAAALRYAQSCNSDLGNAFFYSDSDEDLPLLEAVGKPVAVNAKPSLAKIAHARGWPQLAFVTQGELPLVAA